jgi:PAS domain S-box-containing protein
METHAVPFQMPDGTLAQLAITRDVTKRKQHERKLAESEHRFRQLLQALPAAVYTTDNEGNLTFYNDAAVEFAGKTPELGQKWCVTWRLTYGDGKPMPHEDCPMATTLKEKRPVRDAEAIAERPDGTRRWFVPYPTPIMNSDGEMTGAINMLGDITQRKEAERQQKILIDELNHRVKNSLATVQSIVRQTAANAERVEDYRDMLEARVLAMSRAHDQLSRRQWAAADLHEIAFEGLAAYRNRGNVAIEGEPAAIPPRAALLLSMVVHELATNAAKYGALSSAEGRVDLRWRVAANGKGPILHMDWIESGGPKVQPPERRGFGTRFVENGIRLQCGGKSTIDFAPDGVRCAIELPLDAEDASS